MQLCYGRKHHVSTPDEINYEGYGSQGISNTVQNICHHDASKLEEKLAWGGAGRQGARDRTGSDPLSWLLALTRESVSA